MNTERIKTKNLQEYEIEEKEILSNEAYMYRKGSHMLTFADRQDEGFLLWD